MTHHADDLYLGGFVGTQGLTLTQTLSRSNGGYPDLPSPNPTRQQGVGPMGRTTHLDIVPKALAAANLAVLAAPTLGTPLVLSAGAGITAGLAPDGSGATVYYLDVCRSVSLTSTANLSAINFLVTGYDYYLQKTTQLMAGPNVNTVNSKKAFIAILSIVPQGTSASTVSAGVADQFGLPYVVSDAGYVLSAKWANVMAQNGGTLTVADATNPATSSTGDVRGTFAQSGAASNGANRLVMVFELTSDQCGAAPTIAALLGVTPA